MEVEEEDSKQKANKKLLKFEKPIYEIIKPDKSSAKVTIRAMLNRSTKKPNITAISRSKLFQTLETMLPKLEKSNEELKLRIGQKIDEKLIECSSSSESSESEEKSIANQEQIESRKKEFSDGQFELNILKYPYMIKTNETNENEIKAKIQEVPNYLEELQ